MLHLTAWARATRQSLSGASLSLTPEEDWPEVGEVSLEGWEIVLNELTESHQQLAEQVSELDEVALGMIVPGQQYTVYFLIHGIVQHMLYHAGQIMLLKKAGQ